MRKDLIDSPSGHDIAAQEYGYCHKVNNSLHDRFRQPSPPLKGRKDSDGSIPEESR